MVARAGSSRIIHRQGRLCHYLLLAQREHRQGRLCHYLLLAQREHRQGRLCH